MGQGDTRGADDGEILSRREGSEAFDASGSVGIVSPSSSSSSPAREDSADSCSSLLSSPDISPLVAHYHKYSSDDLGLHVSIAQGGLQRIRREAQSAQISLRHIVEMFGNSISLMAIANDQEMKIPSPNIKAFHGSSVPKISLNDYLWRVVRALNAHSDPCLFASDGSELSCLSEDIGENSAMGRGLRCLLLSFIYIDRACMEDTFRVTSLSAHRILLTAIYLATKFTDDMLPRAHWTFAKLGGITCKELKRLEGDFCRIVDFRLYVTEAEFQAHCMEQLRCAVRSMRYSREKRNH